MSDQRRAFWLRVARAIIWIERRLRDAFIAALCRAARHEEDE